MKKRVVTLLAAVSLVCSQFPMAANAENTSDDGNIMQIFYVSPDGDDNASGTEDAPFRTLEKAQQAVDEINDNMTGDIVVRLMDGTWELDETLKFGQEDSGTNGYYVRYEAADGAEPVISGGTELDNAWELHDSEKGIYKIPLEREEKLRALYVNGERSYMAETENAIAAQGTWGTYTIGNVREVEDYEWKDLYTQDFESVNSEEELAENGIEKYAKNGDKENSVIDIVGEDGNNMLQIAQVQNGDYGFEIPSVLYENGLISFRFQFAEDHAFTQEWEALHIHGANKVIDENGRTTWAGIKLAPHLQTTYFQYGTSGGDQADDASGMLNTTAFQPENAVWYQIKMFITDNGQYYTKIWKDGEEEPSDWSRRETFNNLNDQEKFFRMYAYKNQNQTVIDIRVDDIKIQSGTLKSDVTEDQLPEWAWNTGSKADGLLYNQSDLPLISRNVTDVEIENQQVWNKNTVCVREIEEGTDGKWILKLQQPYGAIAQTPGWGVGLTGSGNHVIKNAYELLDQPGEFYFDRQEQMLYYIPREGEDLSTASVVVPRLENIVVFSGSPAVSGDLTTAGEKTITGQTENIIFDGITIAHSDWNLQKVGDSYGKSTVQAGTVYTAFASGNWHADMYRNLDTIPGAVEMEFAHNIKLLNGAIKLTGAEGVVMSNDVDGCEVTGNYIYQTGGGGVTVGNPQHIYENDSLEPDVYYYHYESGDGKPEVSSDGAAASHEKYQNGTERVPRDVKISNNILAENCRLFPSHCPITSFFTQRMEVSNNFIKDAAYSGMSIGWGWGNFDGTESGFSDWGVSNSQGWSIIPGYPTQTCFDNKIVNNRIDTVMTILHDGGLIYTLGEQKDTEISGNFVTGSQNQGIYQDEGSAYFKPIENNVIKDVSSSAIFVPEYGRKHDLSYKNNYSNSNAVSTDRVDQYPNINIEVEDLYYIPDSIWPVTASGIIQNSGLTSEYRGLLAEEYEGIYGTTADALLPENAVLNTGDSLVLNSWLDSEDEIWLAPANTTEFAESDTMVRVSGDAQSMEVPQTPGDYRLYVKQDDSYSEASAAFVGVEKDETAPKIVSVEPQGEEAATSGMITVTFSEKMGAAGTVTLDGEELTAVQDEENKEVFTAAYEDLECGREYSVVISGFKDAAGNEMSEAETFTFKTVEKKSYSVTVENGTAYDESGNPVSAAVSGEKVTVKAEEAPEGKHFEKWEIVFGEFALEAADEECTTFIMPEGNVSLRAVWADDESAGEDNSDDQSQDDPLSQEDGGSGGGENSDTGNGDSATPQAGDSDAPQTGDETDALSAAALCALSLASAAAVVVLRFGKKKNRI